MSEEVWMADEMLTEEEKKKRMLQKMVEAAKGELGTGHEGEYSKHGDFDESKIFSEQYVTTVVGGRKVIHDMERVTSVNAWAELLNEAVDVKAYDGMPFKFRGRIYTFNAPDNTPQQPVQQPGRPVAGRPVLGKPGAQPISSPAKGDSKKKATATAQSF